jgi:hypothetical protein
VACQQVAVAIPLGLPAGLLSDPHAGRQWWKCSGYEFSFVSQIFVPVRLALRGEIRPMRFMHGVALRDGDGCGRLLRCSE